MSAPPPQGHLADVDPRTLPDDGLGQTSRSESVPSQHGAVSGTSAGNGYTGTAETHAGAVFFAGDLAYKMKKPVDLGFLDFRDLRTRAWACAREWELNRRFAPDVYLDVAEARGRDGQVHEHFVVMRRMPAERSLARLVGSGRADEDAVREVARILAGVHSCQSPSPEVSAEGRADALRDRWDAALRTVRSFAGTLVDSEAVDELEHRARTFVAGRDPLLDGRACEGRVVDGHGDLLSEDIFCLDDGPRVLDCIEFDDRLRWLDGADDAACLAMDLEYRGDPALAERFLGWYAQFSADSAPSSLLHHYMAYRALIRTRVACLKHSPSDTSTALDAREHLRLALAHARSSQVRLVLVGGLPGTGKSTLSEGLADELGATLLASDRIRREVAGATSAESTAEPYRSGLYAPENTDRTYEELLRRASALLARGETVVLDASWTRRRHRQLATDTAESTSSELVPLQCTAPDDVATERIRQRCATISDADEDIAAAMAVDADPWPQAHAVSTAESGSVDRALRVLRARVGR